MVVQVSDTEEDQAESASEQKGPKIVQRVEMADVGEIAEN